VARLCDIGLALARIVGQQGPAHDLGRRVALSAASRQQSHIPGSRPSFECREREARGSTRSGVILRGLSEASLRLCEALSCACLERYRSVLAKHQAEMLERTLRRSFGAQPAALASGSDIRATIADQIEALKTAIKESQSNSNVLSELAARSSGDVANTLQTRMMAALDEFKAALEHAIPERLAFAGTATPPAVMVQPASQS
jgi:phasin family protein